MNHYQRLGVARDVTDAELRRAWHEYALRHHPDNCKDSDAAERFAAGSSAYKTLADPEARAAYNRSLLLEDPHAELGQALGRPLTARERRGVTILRGMAWLRGLL